MPHHTRLLLATTVGAALMLGGCGRTRVASADLPPPVSADQTGQSGDVLSGGAGDGGYLAPRTGPGSQQDLIAQAGADSVYFELDSSTLDETDRATLQRQAQWLQQYPRTRVTIEGHCDERGTREYNIALGERRATAARNYLASLGVDALRMQVVSYGKERPVALGSDEASWAQNRRAATITIS